MGRKRKQKKETVGWPETMKIVLRSVALAALLLAALSGLVAGAMTLGTFPAFLSRGAAVVLLILSAFLSGFLAAKSLRKNGLRIGIICGITLTVFLFFLSGILFAGAEWRFLPKGLIVLAASSIGGVLGVNTRRSYRAR